MASVSTPSSPQSASGPNWPSRTIRVDTPTPLTKGPQWPSCAQVPSRSRFRNPRTRALPAARTASRPYRSPSTAPSWLAWRPRGQESAAAGQGVRLDGSSCLLLGRRAAAPGRPAQAPRGLQDFLPVLGAARRGRDPRLRAGRPPRGPHPGSVRARGPQFPLHAPRGRPRPHRPVLARTWELATVLPPGINAPLSLSDLGGCRSRSCSITTAPPVAGQARMRPTRSTAQLDRPGIRTLRRLAVGPWSGGAA